MARQGNKRRRLAGESEGLCMVRGLKGALEGEREEGGRGSRRIAIWSPLGRIEAGREREGGVQ